MPSTSPRLRALCSSTFLHTQPEVWDAVFPLEPARARFLARQAKHAGPDVLDVGCATGMLSAYLARRGLRPTGVDINPIFIEAARRKYPELPFAVADMRRLPFRRRFDSLLCMGTTFLYNLHNAEIERTLGAFHAALRPGGLLVIDVVNAVAFVNALPFRRERTHDFERDGFRARATLRHTVHEHTQTFTEQVTWEVAGQPPRKDPETHFRMLFPLEAVHYLEGAGFEDVRLLGGFREGARALDGPRLVMLARRGSGRVKRR